MSKKINKSLYTTNYEAVASRPLKGKRPDLVAFTQNSQFTLEAKGRHQTNPGNMADHKAQASSGNYPRNFSVACVSYNLFQKVACKYHDPFNDNILYDNNTLQLITRKYYSGLEGFLNQSYFNYEEISYQGEQFYEIELTYRNLEKLFPIYFPFRHYWYFEFFELYRPRLILPKRISEFSKNGITNELTPFIFEATDQAENIYIDNDRVGLRVK